MDKDKEGMKAMDQKVGVEGKELGLDLEQKQYKTRLDALSNPQAYAAKRQTTFDEMVVHIRKSYDDAFTGFINAGMPTETAKSHALAAANNEKAH